MQRVTEYVYVTHQRLFFGCPVDGETFQGSERPSSFFASYFTARL